MPRILTINKVIDFPNDIEETVIGKEQVEIEGKTDTAETRIYKGTDDKKNIQGYQRFKLKHSQKYKIQGKLWNKEFNHIMRLFTLDVYKSESIGYVYSIGSNKADIAHIAFKRLRTGTGVKCEPYEVDLLEAVEKIIKFAPDIKIKSGWFSNLGLPNLNNVLLQGDEVNLGPEWTRFKKTSGAKLSNIELIIDDSDFDNGWVKVSLSKRGVLFSQTNIPHKKMLQIADKIIVILSKKLVVV
ncbi:hypothetical protein [Bacillus sp. CECT 9360]|uniref:hypothetical protein n=1 Tax=Bacillus sp. CECT 9360 TaxID=2845821 RepID=UPI001E5387B5|nr:hypothetical protein [Bacillus sp. CECT 9360]CAH0346749.1 hypothetical protein BCI9360_03095 [Bacillus sp. CECT 9360]